MKKQTPFGRALGAALCVLLLAGLAHAIDDRSITVTSPADATNRRQALVNFVWGAGGFPSNNSPAVLVNTTSPVAGLNNLERVDTISVSMEGGKVTSYAHHFIPVRKNNRLVVVHHGHAPSFNDRPSPEFQDVGYGMHRLINGLLTDGYSVLAVYMPFNNQFNVCQLPAMSPCINVNQAGGTAKHEEMFTNPFYAPAAGSVLKYFLEPVAVCLNYLKTHAAADNFPAYQDYGMVGLSGGGWTTTVYAALDPTVRLSFPVAGAIPLYNRGPYSVGDTEQFLNGFYQIAGYPDLYLLGSYGQGRKQVWILNRRDDCCFGENPNHYTDPNPDPSLRKTWEQAMRDYEADIRNALYFNFGSVGFFRLEIDEAAPGHMISWNVVVNHILAELNEGRRYIGAASGGSAWVRGLNTHLWYNAAGAWADRGSFLVGVPAVVEGAVNTYDVFYRERGNRLMRMSQTGGNLWTLPVQVSDLVIADPAAVSWGAGRYDVVMLRNDYRLYHYWSGASAPQLINAGVKAVGPPALVTAGPNQLDLFYRGFDRALYHLHFDGATWGGVENLGGVMLDFPSGAATADGVLRAYVRGQSGQLWQAARPAGGSWSLTSVSATIGGVPLVGGSPSASVVGGAVRVHARTPGGNLSTFSLSGTWGWVNNGGGITGSPTSTPAGALVRDLSGGLWRFDGANWISYGGLIE